MAELIARLLNAWMDGLLRKYWKPRIGDRVEFILTPHWHQRENIIEANDRATIVRLIETSISIWNKKPDVVFAMDDGREIRINFFDFSTVRVIGLSRPRKAT